MDDIIELIETIKEEVQTSLEMEVGYFPELFLIRGAFAN